MSARPSLWQRLEHVLRRPAASADILDRPRSSITPASGGVMRLNAESKEPRFSVPRFFGAQTRADTQERLARMTEMMSAMQTHFQTRERQADRMNESIDELTKSLEKISGAQCRTAESMTALTGHVQMVAHRSESLTSTLSELPAAMQAQAEAVRSIARGLDNAAQADARVSEAIDHLIPAVGHLTGMGADSARAFQSMIESEARQRDSLRAIIQQQNRRMTFVIVGAAGVVTACMALLTLAIFSRGVPG